MSKGNVSELSRRERQVMDIIYGNKEATAAEVHAALADPPSYSAVRATLRILEEKGHLQHRHDGPRYVFCPTVPKERARRSAMKRLLSTFFDGSTEQAMAALLDLSASELSDKELDRLGEMIEQVRKDGR